MKGRYMWEDDDEEPINSVRHQFDMESMFIDALTNRSSGMFMPYTKEEMKPSDDEFNPEDREERMFEQFAKEAMDALVEAGQADFVLLRNAKLRKWWQGVVAKELAAKAKKEAADRKKALKEQALSKLSDEEKEALGLNRNKK